MYDAFIYDMQLDKKKFYNPDSLYWPSYFWMWNDILDIDVISSRLKEMNDIGVRSIWALPVPADFRPDSMPTDLQPEYLSAEYLEIYRQYVEAADKLGMKVWLYDDGGWPSGSVCGRIVKSDPVLAAQTLLCESIEIEPNKTFEVPSNCMAAFLYKGGIRTRKLQPSECIAADGVETRIEVYSVKHDNDGNSFRPCYPDLLNKKTTDEFIKLTHEVYKNSLGSYFGNTIPFVFMDEGGVCNPPWTEDIEESFREKYGYSLVENLFALLKTRVEEGSQTRIDYYDWWSERFCDHFLGREQSWCHANSLFLTGHLSGEDYTLGSRDYGYGHILRALRKLDIPGVDAIWRQLFPGEGSAVKNQFLENKSFNHHFPKYASTIAHQKGSRWALTESFAVYGSGLTLGQMKWITHFQYVRGINLMTMGCTHLKIKDYLMARERPMFIKENPQWDYFMLYHCYTARLSYILSLGSPVIESAVYFPIRDIWAADPGMKKVAESNDFLTKRLLELQCDFDFIDDDVLESESTTVHNGQLMVGAMQYGTIYVSKTKWISQKALIRLEEFSSKGGRLIWLGSEKTSTPPSGSIFIEDDQLEIYSTSCIDIEPQNSMIRVCKRRLDEGHLYFVTNEDIKELDCILKFKESAPAFFVDAETGKFYSVDKHYYSNGVWAIPVNLEFAGARLVYFTDDDGMIGGNEPEPAVMIESMAKEKKIEMDDHWFCRIHKSYEIGDHDFEVHDYFQENYKSIQLGDWGYHIGKDFSGTVEYNVKFVCNGTLDLKESVLNLGVVNYNCKVVLNGENLGKRAWPPYEYRVKGILHEGENELQVFVTNTMANQYIHTDVFNKWPANMLSWYHYIALEFEKDSLPSGLYGPVILTSSLNSNECKR